MSSIRKTNTKPELAVRRFLHCLGFRYRLYGIDLPGRPDMVFSSRRAVVMVHGCFWHRCPNCAAGQKLPRSNTGYWLPKLARNQARDVEVLQALQAKGWKVLTIWECQTKNPVELARLAAELGPRTLRAGQFVPQDDRIQ